MQFIIFLLGFILVVRFINNINNYLKEHISKINEIEVMAEYYIISLLKP